MRLKDYPFGHGKFYKLENGISLVGCYHPSPRNVNTGRLNYKQMFSLFRTVKELAGIS
jgi:uracil-DNA glycosylase